MRAEVTVRGAGVLGLACAFACAARGARVRVVDPGGIGAGASGGLVGALSPFAPERWDEGKALQLESLTMAEGFWRAVAEAGGQDPGYARTGRLLPLDDDAAVETARARGAEARLRWPPPLGWTIEPAEGWGPASATGLRVRDTLAARVDPRRALAALAAAIRAQGGEVVAAGPDEGVVVEATGAAGLAARGIGGGVKGQAARLAVPGCGSWPQVHAGGLYVVPHGDGTVAVGSTSEPAWDAPAATDARLDALLARARARVPMLEGAPVVATWAGLRPRARDGAPAVGWRDGVLILNGGFRTGFGLAPLLSRMAADLALGGTGVVPEAWRADRPALA